MHIAHIADIIIVEVPGFQSPGPINIQNFDGERLIGGQITVAKMSKSFSDLGEVARTIPAICTCVDIMFWINKIHFCGC